MVSTFVPTNKLENLIKAIRLINEKKKCLCLKEARWLQKCEGWETNHVEADSKKK